MLGINAPGSIPWKYWALLESTVAPFVTALLRCSRLQIYVCELAAICSQVCSRTRCWLLVDVFVAVGSNTLLHRPSLNCSSKKFNCSLSDRLISVSLMFFIDQSKQVIHTWVSLWRMGVWVCSDIQRQHGLPVSNMPQLRGVIAGRLIATMNL